MNPLRICVTGSHGLIGSATVAALVGRGAEVWRYDRTNPPSLEDCDAVVHLAGETVAGRWTAAKKLRIWDSRVEGTARLCRALAALSLPPRVLVSASAVGIYGEGGAEWFDEASPAGSGFLAGVCREWEAATCMAEAAGIRVVHLRFGLVLSSRGGALARMLPVFRGGVGGRLGDGRQYWSWVALADAVGAIEHALEHEGLRGPVNVVAPGPVTNAEFVAVLGRALRRPARVTVPAAVVRWVFGEFADETLLASVRVRPARLVASGYSFRCAVLAKAFEFGRGRDYRSDP